LAPNRGGPKKARSGGKKKTIKKKKKSRAVCSQKGITTKLALNFKDEIDEIDHSGPPTGGREIIWKKKKKRKSQIFYQVK